MAAKKKPKKASATKTKKSTPKKKSPPRVKVAPGARGKPVIDAIVARLGALSADPRPLTDAEVTAAEKAANAALSPALFAAFTADAGYFARECEAIFDKKMRLLAKPFSEIIEECAGVFAESYESLKERFPGNALLLSDYSGEWFDLLYFGDPDSHGEYPVLHFSYRDEPSVDVCTPGSDVWLAETVDIDAAAYDKDNAAVTKRLFGATGWNWREHLRG